ncbi:N-acetylmuramoyl-L-alanine amidase [Labrys neptuniae]
MSLLATRKSTSYLVVHCTATPEGKDFTAADIDRMHRQRGFTMIGYHYIIRLDGRVEPGRPENAVGAHVEGHNANSVGISYIGGVDAKGKAKDTRTAAQKSAMVRLLKELRIRYPNTKILGHRDFSPDLNGNGKVDPNERIKECPCFDAIPEYAAL